MTKWGLSQEYKVGLTFKINQVIHHMSTLKTMTHVIISINEEKARDKIQHFS